MELEVFDKSGQAVGKSVTLSEDVFNVEPNDHAIYLDVKQYLANKRQGTHKSKERSEIVGSTKKLKKQKGTGTARAGSIKSPVFRGGGRVFGPKPRNYGFKLNKKVKNLARRSVLTYKVQDNKLKVIQDVVFDSPKTKEYKEFLNSLNVQETKTLFVVSEDSRNVYLSARNVEKAEVRSVDSVNTYDLLKAENVLVSETSISRLEEILKK